MPNSAKAESSVAVVDVSMGWEDDDDRVESWYSNTLEQLPVTYKQLQILNDPSRWEREESGMKTNKWPNSSTGYIGSGRRNWDGSGGIGASL